MNNNNMNNNVSVNVLDLLDLQQHSTIKNTAPQHTLEQDQLLDKLTKLFILYKDSSIHPSPSPSSPSPSSSTSASASASASSAPQDNIIQINDLKWINFINKSIINNNLISFNSFNAFNIILYFNQGYNHITHPNNNNMLLFVHYIRSAYPSLDSIWKLKSTNHTTPFPLTITYIGLLTNDIFDEKLWNELWTLTLDMQNNHNTTEQIISQSLLLYCLIQHYTTHTNNTLPLIDSIFPTFQQSLYNFIKSTNDPLFNQWDFNSLIVIWTSTLQLLSISNNNITFNSTSSNIYNEIIAKPLIWKEFDYPTYKELIQNGIDHLINGHIPRDILIGFPALIYLEAYNNKRNLTLQKRKKSLGNFDSMEDLHNLIIKINQCYSQIYNDQLNDELTIIRLQTNNNNNKNNDISINNIDMWKRNLLISMSPQKFKSIIKDYTIIPTTISHWLLLESTWFEFIRNLSNTEYIFQENSFLNIISNQKNKLPSLDSKTINNNLSICSLPIILLILGPTTSKNENNTNNNNQLNLNSNFKRFLLFITDVLLVQLKLFAYELNDPKFNHKNKVNEFLLNPIVQLLLYVWYTIIYKMDGLTTIIYSQLEIDSVTKFMTTYIMNSKKNIDTDKLLEQDLNKILFERDTYEYLGYHFLLSRTISFIKNELILNKLLSSQYLPNNIKFEIIEFVKSIHHNDDVLESDQIIKYSESQNNNNTFNDNIMVNNGFDLNDLTNSYLETKPITFNSISSAFNSNGNGMIITSPIMKATSISSNTNSISKPSSNGRPSITLAQSPMAISPYSTSRRRRSSVISVTEDGKNYLLPPLNFDPIQMDSTVLSSASHNNSKSSSTNTKNNNSSGTTTTSNNSNNNNANYSFNTLNNYNFREAIFTSPINKKRRASVPIIPPNSSYLTGSNNTVGNNYNNNPLTPSHNTNPIIRHSTLYPYGGNGPSTSIMVTGPSIMSNNHIFSGPAGGSIPTTKTHTLKNNNSSISTNSFPKSIDRSVNNSGSSTISNSHENSEDLSETTVPLPSPSQLFGI
ncbi:hypothetical protein MOSE0_M08966 [Monosporozyma servazzii]